MLFPAGFRWGAAASAYQIEGAVRDDGRGLSIWDTFSHTPGKVAGGDTGDVACDHYHRYADDVALMARLGLQAYRFSVAWPRVQPDGRGPVNPAGLDFYDRLVDELVSHGIEPLLTLYHWDLPQSLEDAGGWPERETVHRFAEYATLVYGRLGDRVHTWFTINEPVWPSFLGYASGTHAPGRTDPAAAFAAAHHMLLGHGEAARALRALGAEAVGIAHDPPPVRPADPANPADVAGARIVHTLRTRVFLDPVTGKGYPAEVLELAERYSGTGWLQDGDEQTIGAGIDLLGVNYYQPTVIAARPGGSGDPAFPGTEGLAWVQPPGPVTTMGWVSEPASLTDLLVRLARDYPGIPLWVTENGAAYDDKPDVDGTRVADPDRIAYLDGHVRAVHAAIAQGIDVRGYIVWSLLDNFEWAEGYRQRFGLVYVDYQTQARIPKDSAHWYHRLITTGELPMRPTRAA